VMTPAITKMHMIDTMTNVITLTAPQP